MSVTCKSHLGKFDESHGVFDSSNVFDSSFKPLEERGATHTIVGYSIPSVFKLLLNTYNKAVVSSRVRWQHRPVHNFV